MRRFGVSQAFLVALLFTPVVGLEAQLPPDMPGWPMILPLGANWRGPTLADLDGDGSLEIIVGSTQPAAVHAFGSDGVEISGWPFTGGGNALTAPVVGDLDGDGQQEVVYFGASQLNVLNSDGVPRSGWPLVFDLDAGAGSHLLLSDVNGDGGLEIIFCTLDGPTPTVPRVHAYTGAGVLLSSDWPANLDVGAWTDFGLNDNVSLTGLSTGDLDGDGAAEVIVTFLITDNGLPTSSPVFVLDGTGDDRDGWPRTMPGSGEFVASSPIVVDYDGDTIPEIVTPGDGRVDVWEGDGSSTPISPGLPVGSTARVVPGDLDSDGDVDIVYSYTSLILIDRDTPLLVYEVLPIEKQIHQVTVVDIEGDGVAELCVASREGSTIYVDLVHSETGESLPGWPWQVPGIQSGKHAWGDLEGDGDVELVIASGRTLAVLDFPATSTQGARLTWPALGSGKRRSFAYGEGVTLPVWFLRGDANGDGAFNIADPVTIIAETVLGQSATYDCDASRDFSGDGMVDLTDAVSFLEFLFAFGPLPGAPFPTCGSVAQASLAAECSANVCPE